MDYKIEAVDILYVIPKPEVISGDVVIPYEKMKSPIVYISLGSIS